MPEEQYELTADEVIGIPTTNEFLEKVTDIGMEIIKEYHVTEDQFRDDLFDAADRILEKYMETLI